MKAGSFRIAAASSALTGYAIIFTALSIAGFATYQLLRG